MIRKIKEFYDILSIPINLNVINNTIFNKEPMNLDVFLDSISKIIDQEIIKISKKENIKPLGGELRLCISERCEDVCIYWDFYFETENKSTILKSSERLIKSNNLNEESIKYIKLNNPTFVIESPSINVV